MLLYVLCSCIILTSLFKNLGRMLFSYLLCSYFFHVGFLYLIFLLMFYFIPIYVHCMIVHSSEIRGLCLMKLSSEMLQNLPCFWNKKPQLVFDVFISSNFGFITVDAILVYVYYLGFLFPNIWQILKHFPRQFHRA